MQTHFWRNTAAALVILALGVGMFYVISSKYSDEVAETTPQTQTITLTVEGVYSGKEVAVSAGETVLGLLQRLDGEDPALRLKTKTYPGLGIMVEELGDRSNGTEGKYWQYFINGVLAPVGAEQYVPNGDDRVEWRFTAPESL